MTHALLLGLSLVGLGTWRTIFHLPDPLRAWRDELPIPRVEVPEELLTIRPTNNDWKGLV